MKTQAMRPHLTIWLLLLLAAMVIGFFIMTVKPAAQAPESAVGTSQIVPAQTGNQDTLPKAPN